MKASRCFAALIFVASGAALVLFIWQSRAKLPGPRERHNRKNLHVDTSQAILGSPNRTHGDFAGLKSRKKESRKMESRRADSCVEIQDSTVTEQASTGKPAFPIVAVVTYGMRRYASNWMLGLERISYPNWRIFAADNETAAYLRGKHPDFVGHVQRIPERLIELPQQHRSHLKAGTQPYVQYVRQVPLLLRWLVNEEIRGPFIYSDADIAILADPSQAMRSHFGDIDADVIAQSDDAGISASCPRYCADARKTSLCSGFFFLNGSSPAVPALLDAWLAALDTRPGYSNQAPWNIAIRSLIDAGSLRAHTLPCHLFPNGYRFFCPKITKEYLRANHLNGIVRPCGFNWTAQQPQGATAALAQPAVVHANYLKAGVKFNFLQEAGLWLEPEVE